MFDNVFLLKMFFLIVFSRELHAYVNLFGSYFLKMFLEQFLKTQNTIFVFFENCSYYLNLLFSMFSVFLRTKK